jgi:putative Holliday junction resolvase
MTLPSNPPRLLALDVGQKRIGVAATDELGITVQPLLTIHRKGTREDLRSAARLARRVDASAIIVGDPLNMDGSASAQTERARQFARELGELTGLPIHLHDERLTSREAHEILYRQGHDRQQHAELVDQVAAVLILESYLRQSPLNA